MPILIWYISCNLQIIEKLSVSAPPADVKLKVLKAIALEYNVNWDSTKTEQEFSKKPEDLLVSISSQLFIIFYVRCTWPMALQAFDTHDSSDLPCKSLNLFLW